MTHHRRTNSIQQSDAPLLPLNRYDKPAANDGLGFMDKWRERKQQISRGETRPKGHYTMKALICFHTPTYIYAMMTYIVPHLFGDLHPWTQYYIKMFLWFILMNVLINFICTALYSSFYEQTKDNPYLTINHVTDSLPETFGERIQHNNLVNCNSNGQRFISKDDAPDWSLCGKCNVFVPPRTYHCRFCKKCVTKRDHHCFIVGKCVGFRNQRYFIVMLFYCLIIGVVGLFLTIRYIQDDIWPTTLSWTNAILPFTLVRCISGRISVFDTLLFVHCYIYAFYIILGLAYFPSQMWYAVEGKTMLEVAKKVPVTNFSTWRGNLTSVFGECWLLNFLFPMTLIFRQPEDGVHWENVKMDHNSNRMEKEDLSWL